MTNTSRRTAASRIALPVDTIGDMVIDCGKWDGNRAVLVHRREHGGRSYIRFRTWNRHKTKNVWYPTKRGFIVPLDRAEALAESLRLGAHGEPREKPNWFVEWERESARKV